MCGITGFFRTEDTDLHVAESIIMSMTDSLIHRGPDDSGIWHQHGLYSIGLVHRRLSILDLSKAGHQPMTSSNKRYVVSYNGEIYNHLELRKLIDKRS